MITLSYLFEFLGMSKQEQIERIKSEFDKSRNKRAV